MSWNNLRLCHISHPAKCVCTFSPVSSLYWSLLRFTPAVMNGSFSWIDACVRGVWIGATPDNTRSPPLLITARQINAAHLAETLSMAKDPGTSACRSFTLSWHLYQDTDSTTHMHTHNHFPKSKCSKTTVMQQHNPHGLFITSGLWSRRVAVLFQ